MYFYTDQCFFSISLSLINAVFTLCDDLSVSTYFWKIVYFDMRKMYTAQVIQLNNFSILLNARQQSVLK